MNLAVTAKSFGEQIQRMVNLFNGLDDILKQSKINHYLLGKQQQRLRTFLKELQSQCKSLESMSAADEHGVIFIFERQHLFKNIFGKHLRDFAKIYSIKY